MQQWLRQRPDCEPVTWIEIRTERQTTRDYRNAESVYHPPSPPGPPRQAETVSSSSLIWTENPYPHRDRYPNLHPEVFQEQALARFSP